jgi:putative phosphoesterase
MDRGPWAQALPPTLVVQVQQAHLYVLHDLLDLDLNPKAAGFQAVIYGHTHRPEVKNRRGVWFINPGSAASPRGSFPPSLALLRIQGDQIQAELVRLGF